MISKNLKIKAGIFSFFLLVVCRSGFAAAPAYTVHLGDFKTIPAVTEFYHLIPQKYHPNTFVCRQGETYILNCGSYAQEKDIQPLFVQLKDMGLNPRIVKTESTGCSPADVFFKSAQLPPPPPPAIKQKPYADMSDPDVVTSLENHRTVLPEVTAKILLSNRDVNRIICQAGAIKDVVFSQEKGISVKTSNNNAFVKFLITGNTGNTNNMTYADIPSEIYVVCGVDNAVYTLIAEPRNIPAQTIELVSRKKDIQKTLSVFEGLAFEKKIILMISSAYKNDIADGLSTKAVNQPLDVFRDMDVLFSRKIDADGEGLTLNEYILSIKPTSTQTSISIIETMFLVPELTRKPVGVALEHMTLTMGQPTRLFMVETHTD
jgi:hypothetical protein